MKFIYLTLSDTEGSIAILKTSIISVADKLEFREIFVNNISDGYFEVEEGYTQIMKELERDQSDGFI